MNLTDRQKSALQAILADREHFANQDWSGYGHGREKIRTANAYEGYVRTDPLRWLGMAGTNGDYVQISRLYRQLENKGLATRHSLCGGHHTTHLKLTSLVKKLAEQLLTQEAKK